MNMRLQLVLCWLYSGYAGASYIVVPANGYGWTLPFFPGSYKCVTAVANTTTVSNLTVAIVEQADFNYFRANTTSRGYKPIDSLFCAGAHVSGCLVATGDLQTGVNYTIIFENPQNFSLNVTYQYGLGCSSNSPLLRGGGLAGTFVTNTGGLGGGYSFGRTVQIANVQCLSFLAVATTRLVAWVYYSSDAANFLKDPVGYRYIAPIPGGFCNTTTFCNITLTNLSTTSAYNIFYQPLGTPVGGSDFVAYSLLPSCYPARFTIPPNSFLPFGPITGVTGINYTLEAELYILTAVVSNTGPIASKIFQPTPKAPYYVWATGLSPSQYYWIGIQHNDYSEDSALVFFNLTNPAGYYNQSLTVPSGRRLLQLDTSYEDAFAGRQGRLLHAAPPFSAPGQAPAPGPAGAQGNDILTQSGLAPGQLSMVTANGGYNSLTTTSANNLVQQTCFQGSISNC